MAHDYEEYFNDDEMDWSEVDGYGDDYMTLEEGIESVRGTVSRCPCLICGADNAMVYEEGEIFICKVCNTVVGADAVYQWAAGFGNPFEEDNKEKKRYYEMWEEN